jgi:Protein of unknown function (DUF1214)
MSILANTGNAFIYRWVAGVSTPFEDWLKVESVLQKAAQDIQKRTQDDPDACAEGLRFVTRLFDGMRDAALEQDAGNPAFSRIMTPSRRYFADCPDVDYHRAVLSGDLEYRITGNRHDCSYLSFCLYALTPQGIRIVGSLSDRDMDFDNEGNFEVYLAAERGDRGPSSRKNRLELFAGGNTLVARQYFLDRTAERPATLSIVRTPSAPLYCGYAEKLAFSKLARSFEHGFRATLTATDQWVTEPNSISISSHAENVADLFPTPDNYYVGGWYELGDDQVLELRVTPPQCRYWSVHLMSRWLESIEEPEGRQIINKRTAVTGPSGEVVITISAQPSSRPNCLSAAGRKRGFFVFRWLQAPELPAAPVCRILSTLCNHQNRQ